MTIDTNQDLSKGEKHSPHWAYQFVDLTQIEAGQLIVPAKIDSEAGREFAALQLIRTDLSFALECLKEADKIGLPDSANIHSRALIFSAVVAYARPFMTGVRKIRLDGTFFTGAGKGFNIDLHTYLIAVRNKHVAHSVNEFERCEATAVMVGTNDQTEWRAAGVGFTEYSVIGLSRSIVEQAIDQISNMVTVLAADLDRRRLELYEAFRAQYERDGKWEMAPMFNVPSRKNAPNRRA